MLRRGHILQAGDRAEQRPIPAKGLTGTGYDGHTFWDTETFVLPVLTYTVPDVAADALRWRHSTLDMARERAALIPFISRPMFARCRNTISPAKRQATTISGARPRSRAEATQAAIWSMLVFCSGIRR